MLKNYFKIAIAVLQRRKFFTFISLFGISFTLATLLVMTSFLDTVINDEYPDAKRSRSIYIQGIEERGKTSRSSSALSLGYVNKYVLPMKTPESIAFHSMQIGTNAYHNGKKISVSYKFVNSVFWDIMEFDFLQGKPFSAQQINNLDKVAVISQDLSDAYFGTGEPAVGKYLEVGNDKYRISGVVKNVPATAYMLNGDMYIPYTLSQDEPHGKSYFGTWNAVLLARSKGDMALIQKEYKDIVSRLPHSEKRYDRTLSNADEYLDAFMRTGNQDGRSKTWIYSAIGIFVFLIVLLPVVNLVNINITRIMERSSEIAVRKAFGATSNTLVYQFIVENIILTLLGGLFGLLLAQVFLWILNSADLLKNVHLTLNLTVLFTGLLLCLIFGFLSGVYPAWRMSRFPIVKALKA